MNVKKGEKELAVYEAVCRLWHQGADLRGLTVQAIAAEAGIGKGTVYEYFTSREEILGKAFLYEIDRSLDRVEEKLAEAPAFGEKLNVLFAAADTLVRLEAAGMQAVSYPHLDVYKRQALDGRRLDEKQRAECCRALAHGEMAALREAADCLEKQVPQRDWPIPDYCALLFDL